MGKQAIVVVSFGTSHRETCERNIAAIEGAIAAAYPEWTVRRAFTSGMIRRKLRERDGVVVDSVAQALERLAGEGVQRVLCQPTHVIAGEEYDKLCRTAREYAPRFAALEVGAPLLFGAADYRSLAGVLGTMLPAQTDTAYCLMGHGSAHPSDAAYAALETHLRHGGRGDILVGTVEGYPDFEAMRAQVKAVGAERCVLLPLMVVAGDHAVNDMASEEEDSWKSRLEREGLQVECVLKGLGEVAAVRELYVRHVEATMQRLCG